MEWPTTYIKHMVCRRCVMAVEDILDEMALPYARVDLGEVLWQQLPGEQIMQVFEEKIRAKGFELVDGKKSRIIHQIKTFIVELVHHTEETQKLNLSALLSEKFHYEYNYLSALFSEIEGSTIEKYYIEQRIERVKELLVYDELNLNEIADKLGYSSVAHLSGQFKKVTGLTPSHFRKIGSNRRRPIDEL